MLGTCDILKIEMNKDNKISEGVLAEIIKAYLEAKEANKSLLKYNLNIIEELHANENAHTRILLEILNYEDSNGEKIFLKEFIKLLNEQLNNGFQIDDSEISAYDIAGQFAYIDGYITSKNNAIIIENKINGAVDQYEQLQNYINTAQKQYINPENIYVVYLTNDGTKEVSNISLTEYAKEILKYKDNHGRFIEINYRDHLLPLFRFYLKSLDGKNEKTIETALYQYIDFLEGRFNLRDSENKFNKAVNEALLTILNEKLLKDASTDSEKFECIEKLQNELSDRLAYLRYNEFPDCYETRAWRIVNYYSEKTEEMAPFNKVWTYHKKTAVFEGFTYCDNSYFLNIELSGNYLLFGQRTEPKNICNSKELCDILENQDFVIKGESCTLKLDKIIKFEEENDNLKDVLSKFFLALGKLPNKE